MRRLVVVGSALGVLVLGLWSTGARAETVYERQQRLRWEHQQEQRARHQERLYQREQYRARQSQLQQERQYQMQVQRQQQQQQLEHRRQQQQMQIQQRKEAKRQQQELQRQQRERSYQEMAARSAAENERKQAEAREAAAKAEEERARREAELEAARRAPIAFDDAWTAVYECGARRRPALMQVTRSGNKLRAVKKSGDKCVSDKVATWEVELPQEVIAGIDLPLTIEVKIPVQKRKGGKIARVARQLTIKSADEIQIEGFAQAFTRGDSTEAVATALAAEEEGAREAATGGYRATATGHGDAAGQYRQWHDDQAQEQRQRDAAYRQRDADIERLNSQYNGSSSSGSSYQDPLAPLQ